MKSLWHPGYQQAGWQKQWLPCRRSLLPRAWYGALIPFPFPFERLPRRLVNRSKDHCCPDLPSALECTEQACIRTAPHANSNYKLTATQAYKTQAFRLTGIEQIQAYRPTGVKNYMLADFFFSFFLFLFFLFFCESNTQGYRHVGRHKTAQTCCLSFFFFFVNETHKLTATQAL